MRRRFIVCRGLLRRALAPGAGRAPEDLVFAYGRWGKPELAPQAGARAHFNVTHCGRFAAIVFALDRAVGIDLERANGDMAATELEAIARRFFSPADRAELSLVTDTERAGAFARIWTRHEAILKAAGTGFGDIASAQHAVYERVRSRFCVRTFDAAPGFFGAVAAECDAPLIGP